MHFTHNTAAITIMLGAALLSTGLAACGQITGLSDDYDFDLVAEGGALTDASSDGAPTDAASDRGATTDAPRDASNACSTVQTAAALQRLDKSGGTTLCKACLAAGCCTDVDACLDNQPCSRVLDCKLGCTTQGANNQAQCFKGCDNTGGGPPALYTNGIAACSAAACKQQCGFL